MGNKASTSGSGNKKITDVKPQEMLTSLACPPQCVERSLSYEVDRGSPLHRLPNELFLMILRFVPPMDLIRNGRLVCKYWLELMDSSEFWRRMCQLDGVPYPQEIGAQDSNADSCALDFRSIYLKRPFHRNLVKNWNAADGFNHWTITGNDGDGFAVEPNNCSYSNPVSSIGVSGCSNCWATSFGWCEKFQTIDLLVEGCTRETLDQLKPTIKISEWTAARFDCGSQYFVHVTLESSEGKVLDIFKSERYVDQWENMSWIKVSHQFCNYPSGVRFVKVVHGGKDRQFWKGHYGPKITATCVMVSLENCHLCALGEQHNLLNQ